VRTLIRLVVLGLAAYGAKTLYDQLAPRKDELRQSGAQLFDRTAGAAREMGDKLSGATQSIVGTAQEQAAEMKNTAAEQADVVRSAADDFTTSATGPRPTSPPT
jgi:ElaB/YqjD/DUF883 family membrane-anchored ribosome-binding protein